MILYGLVTVYSIYKIYSFRKNVQCTLSYILSNQRCYQQNILSNNKYLPTLAEITVINFKDVRTDIANLKAETNNKFDRYLHKLMHTTAVNMFLYYHNITAHTSLVTTIHFFYLLNINDELTNTCGKYGRQTICHSHSVSIIKRTDSCDCITWSVEIQLICSHSNCNSNGNFIIYHTFNFVTEWLHNKAVMPYYRKNKHLLHLPSKASISNFTGIKSNQSGVFSVNRVPPISVKSKVVRYYHRQPKAKQNLFIKVGQNRTRHHIFQ